MTEHLDCACVIHGDRYDWRYVENLYAMIRRNLSRPVRFHVFTEAHRAVPDHMIRHDLQEWPEISSTKQAWWYKMQMFDPRHALGQLLYFDLDVVICDNIDWVLGLDRQYFWAINDWRRLWKSHWQGINSSMMYWNNRDFLVASQWFRDTHLREVMRCYRGDQDLLTAQLPTDQVRYFPDTAVRSWRWQVRDGGMDTRTRRYHQPGQGSVLEPGVSVVVFHGSPKPHEVRDELVSRCWRR